MMPSALQDQVNTLLVVGAALGSVGVHAYQIVVKAGGLRGIWRQFLNGTDKPPTP